MTSSRTNHHSPDYQDDSGKFSLAYHLEMIRDEERVGQIYKALDEVLRPDSIHCELGVGTGLFTLSAAQRCAKVYAVEKDPAVFELAQKNIAYCIASNGGHKKIRNSLIATGLGDRFPNKFSAEDVKCGKSLASES